MKTQIIYALADIRRKKLYFSLFFIQLLTIILLVTVSYFLSLKKAEALDNLYAKFDTDNSYYMSVDAKKTYYDGEDVDSKLHDMYEYIKESSDYLLFSSVPNYVEINDLPKNKLFEIVEYGPDKVSVYNTLAVSSDFIDIFDLTLAKGNFFPSDWEYASDQSIPVVLGSGFQAILELGSEFTDDNNLKYEVVGFLQAGEGYVDISGGEGVSELTNVIVMPIDVVTLPELYETGNVDYESYFAGATLITKNNSTLEALRTVGGKSDEFSLEFKSLKGVAKYMESSTKESVLIFIFIAVLFIILSTTLVIVNTLEFVRKNLREFSIHIFCGATRVDIGVRIFLQIVIVWLLATIGSFCFNYFILGGSSFTVLSISVIMLFLCLVTCLPSFSKLFKLQVSDIMRRRE